jgi:hypothetical protein
LSTCWHGKEGFCEICNLICVDDTHLKAVKVRELENGKKDKKKDN